MIKGKPAKNNFKDIKKDIEKFKKSVVKVGLPAGKSGSYEDGTTIIQVGIIHEFGSPARGIPQRSFLRAPMKMNKDKIKRLIFKEYNKVVDGKTNVNTALNALGAYGESLSVASFRKNDWKPNAPITVEGGWMSKGGKAFKVKGKGSNTPLVDTGQLRQAITYIVEN